MTVVPGGYRISGTWPSLSGVSYAQWVGLFMLVPSPDGKPPVMAEALVPAGEVRIENTWNVAGRGFTAG